MQRLWLGPSGVHGWGGFVKEPIKKHQFIHEYVGEVSPDQLPPLTVAASTALPPHTEWTRMQPGHLAAGSGAPRPSVRRAGALSEDRHVCIAELS